MVQLGMGVGGVGWPHFLPRVGVGERQWGVVVATDPKAIPYTSLPSHAKDASPKTVMQRSQVCDLLVIKAAKPNIREVNNG